MEHGSDVEPLVGRKDRKRALLPSLLFVAPLFILGVIIVTMFALQEPQNSKLRDATTPVLTRNPIIGVHAHESLFDDEFIAASYVKWIESAGGRAVRIPYNASKEELSHLLRSVNGLLFPGGYGEPTDQAAFMYKSVIEMNANGTHFPLWGTCLGFEWLIKLQSRNMSILDHVDAHNLSSTLKFLHFGSGTPSRLFSFSPYFQALATSPLAFNYHQYGILHRNFSATEALTSFFKPLATSEDRKGRTYVAAIESIAYPIYGIQFHPEKNAYEFGMNPNGRLHYAIDHSYESIMASQAFAHFFIAEARKNDHAFPTAAEENAALLYNAPRSNRSYPSYEEIFIFKKGQS
ncbi:hypothetical protein LEN26_005715 [Aphanomyces euteiches]|nr:hypothetical protein AeMF1_015773 [Aphanomyces euteiches]KAH9137484.1 hypothetical protein LEN26_005715 [Aphanomyces euteiches]KAH9197086.1 hypothetical protein AeNC1_000941 [Aphanomyces euteiches]